MRGKIWVAALLLVLGNFITLTAQDIAWARSRTRLNTFSQPLSFNSDKYGNTYALEYHSAMDEENSRLTKFDQNGSLVTSRTYNGKIIFSDLKYDSQTDHLFACGTFEGTIIIGNKTLISRGGSDGFIAELDLTGNIISVSTFGGSKRDDANTLIIDNSTGKLIISGGVTDSVYFNNTLHPRQQQSLYIASFSKTLVLSNVFFYDFVPGLNGSDFSSGKVLKLKNGNIYLLHDREGSHPLDDNPTYPLSGRFVMKLSSAGSILWNYRIIGGESYYGWDADDITVNEDGDVFTIRTGYGKYGGNSEVLRLNSSTGTVTWTYSLTTEQRYYDLSTDKFNNLIILGNEGWNGCPCESSTYGYDVLKKFNSSNALKWEKRYYDIRSDRMTLDHEENIVFLGGLLKQQITLGTFSLSEQNGTGFIAKVINGGAAPTISTGPLASTTYSPGSTLSIPYTVSAAFSAGNIFTAQLSDAGGSFKNAVNIGSLASTKSGSISATIPSTVSPGSGYRIRVIGSIPLRYGSDNGMNITIGGTQTFIEANASWRYLDNGSNQGTAWRSLSFHDGAWKTGNAQLGYGDGDEATVVSYGPSSSNKFITTYFRKTISIQNPQQYSVFEFTLMRDDGAVVYVNGVEVRRSNMPSGTVSYTTRASSGIDGSGESAFSTFTVSPSKFVGGNNVIAVEIHQSSSSSSDISFALTMKGKAANPAAGTDLVAANSSWKFLDNGTYPVNYEFEWFDDSSWKTGNAELGYGDGDEATKVSYGSNSSLKHVTTYFRKKFNADASEINALALDLIRDDGAIVYLNGVEVFRSNMPAGTISNTTLASSTVDGTAEKTWLTANVPITHLRNGENVMAVEIHQSSRSSSDISFNLRLRSVPASPSDEMEVSHETIANLETPSGDIKTKDADVLVYPNPGYGFFTLEYNDHTGKDKRINVQLVSLTGQVVYSEELYIESGYLKKEIVTPNGLESGIYMCEIFCEDVKRKSMKLVVSAK